MINMSTLKPVGIAAGCGAGVTYALNTKFVRENKFVQEHAWAKAAGLGGLSVLLASRYPRIATACAVMAGAQLYNDWDAITAKPNTPPPAPSTIDAGSIYDSWPDAGATYYAALPTGYEAGSVFYPAPDAGSVLEPAYDAGAVYADLLVRPIV
jgi:hypothetical protein